MNNRQKLIQEKYLNDEDAIIRKLKTVYNQSLDEIKKKSQALQIQIMDVESVMASINDTKELARLNSVKQSKVYQKQYQDALKAQVGSILDNMQVEEFKTISNYLNKCYENGFVGTMYDLQGQGIPLCVPIDQEAMVRAVQLDSKISNGLYSRLGEDVSMLKRKITAQVSRSISTGMSNQQVAQQLESYTNIGYNNAVRIVRTEGHRIQVQSAMDACEKAREKGADVVKQWDSSLDMRTRENHQSVDGEIKELDEKFSNGLMFPGDPSGGAAEVVNCRCALLQRARWALKEKANEETGEVEWFDDSFKKMDNEKGELVNFKGVKDYDEFKEKYWQAAKIIEQKKTIYKVDHDCTLAKKFGTEHYDAMHKRISETEDQNLAAVWKKYESQINVGDANYRGHEHCMGSTIYVNGTKDAKGNYFQEPYQVSFHEAGHAIDSLTRKTVANNNSIFARHYSSAYKDGIFPETIKEEVNEIVKTRDKELKGLFKEKSGDVEWFYSKGFIGDWNYMKYKHGEYPVDKILPKYRKEYAYASVQKEVKDIASISAYGDLSDILEGATGGKIRCNIGHGVKYWKDRTYNGVADGLATEAFAEMIDSTFSNQASLDILKKYLPKSYGIFKEMIAELLI